jgi:antitoxin component YwqK of YwqJK toxin-antitoxin module
MGIFDSFKNLFNNLKRDIESYSTDDDIKNKSLEEDKLIKKNQSNSKPTKKSLNPNNKVWNRNLEILPPHNIPLFGEIASDNSSFTYYRKNKPFSGIVYYLFNEEERDFSSLKEEEKLKFIKYEIDIKNGIKDGEQRIFNEQQDLITKIEVKNDIKNGFERRYNNNKIITEKFYENGIRNGLETSYYENGQIQSQMEWVNGKCTGKNKFFDQNGNLLTETTYKNGKHIGPQKCWNEIGEEIDCDLTPFKVHETIISSEEEEDIKKQKKEDDQKNLEKIKSDNLHSKEKNYKKVQDIINIDVSKLQFFDFDKINEWYTEVFKNLSEYKYYLIFTDYNSSGGVLQFEKSEKNKNTKVISELKEEYETENDSENFDITNDIYENKNGFSTFQIWELKSNKFPSLITIKLEEYINTLDKDDIFIGSEFRGWLDEDSEYLGYETCELIIDSIGLSREKDLECIFYDQQLNIVRIYGTPFDLSTNPFVISYSGYNYRGEHELFLGRLKK